MYMTIFLGLHKEEVLLIQVKRANLMYLIIFLGPLSGWKKKRRRSLKGGEEEEEEGSLASVTRQNILR